MPAEYVGEGPRYGRVGEVEAESVEAEFPYSAGARQGLQGPAPFSAQLLHPPAQVPADGIIERGTDRRFYRRRRGFGRESHSSIYWKNVLHIGISCLL